jgi:glycosyltransferase involved in cell wall biosynthesis
VSGPRTCIIQPGLGVLTETFIEAHHRHLPNPVLRLHGKPFPLHDDAGRPVVALGHRWVHRALARVARAAPERIDYAVSRALPERLRVRGLARSLRRERVQVVLAEYGPTGVFVREACVAAGIPLVVHFHGFDAYSHAVLEAHREGYRRLFADAAALVAVSKHMREQLVALGAPAHKVEYNPYGIEVDDVPRADPAATSPVFLSVGRFVDKKAPQLTLLAFERVSRQHPDARLVMLGDGPLRQCCVDLANSLGLRERVKLPGPCSHPEVFAQMARASCFVQHSLRPPSGDMEGTPLAVLEAMAAALPVVATRHGGIAEVVADERTGFLVEEGDVDGMAARMARLAGTPRLARELGAAGREFVAKEHGMQDRIRALAAILERSASFSRHA